MNVGTINSSTVSKQVLAENYDRVCSRYDRETDFFSGGQNLAARLTQVDDLEAGERALYVGAGSALDAIEAARKGVEVTCLDVSEGMVELARARFAEANVPGEFVCADITAYEPDEPFDAVVSNFFLNVFARPTMEQILTRLVGFARPGGKLLIADFAPVRGNLALRALHKTYYGVGIGLYWMRGLCSLHRIYKYADYYSGLGLSLRKTRHFRVARFGPWMFQTTVAIKDGRPSAVYRGVQGYQAGALPTFAVALADAN